MSIEMREIEAFLAVADELHFGRAAEKLMLSTSRVSSLVRTVERRAGSPLFERTSRRVRLTPQGEHLATELRAAVVRIERALAEVRQSGGGGGELLRVGFATTLPEKLPAELVQAFEAEYPSARVVQSANPTTDLFAWLGSKWPVDVFVTWMPVDNAPESELSIGPVIHRVPRAVMLPANDPLADRAVVDIEDLVDRDVIYPSLPKWYGDAWTPCVTPKGRELRLVRPPAEYIEDVLRLVADSGMVHLTFASLLDVYRRPGVVVLPVTGLPEMPVRAVWPSNVRNSVLHEFVSIVS